MKYLIVSEGEQFTPGTKVKVVNGGVNSGKTGVVISPREVPTDGKGVPKLTGHYKPVDWKKEVAIKLDSGEVITMFKNRVEKL